MNCDVDNPGRATLFYTETQQMPLALRAAPLIDALGRTGQRPHLLRSDSQTLSMAAGPVRVDIVETGGPVDLSSFERISRPTEPHLPVAAVRARLRHHRQALRIAVTSTDGLPPARLMALAYVAVRTLVGQSRPDLISWGPALTLYDPEEFTAVAARPEEPERADPQSARAPNRPGAEIVPFRLNARYTRRPDTTPRPERVVQALRR